MTSLFVSQLKQRWNELRGSVFSESHILDKIDSYTTTLNTVGAIQQNFSVWEILGIYIWPNQFVGIDYKEENDYLKSWISNRLTWMDTAINEL